MAPAGSDDLDTKCAEMAEHVRWEVVRLIAAMRFGNQWIRHVRAVPPDYANFAYESMLVATLVHLRNVIEFLTTGPGAKRIVARDYWPDWRLGKRSLVSADDERDMIDRVGHIGVKRASVAGKGAFVWNEFLAEHMPRTLHAFRSFLAELPDERRELLYRPTPEHQYLDLAAAIDRTIGPES